MYVTTSRSLAHAAGRAGTQRSLPLRVAVSSLSLDHRTSCSQGPFSCSQGDRRHYAAIDVKPNGSHSIAVLGGGLTGLTAAWYLTRALPDARITLYEANNKLGGWIGSSAAKVKSLTGEEGIVLFHRAARMVRPQVSGRIPRYDDLVFFDMVTNLYIRDQLLHTQEATSGFIYYPDRLVQLPQLKIKPTDPLGSLQSLAQLVGSLAEPLFRDAIPSIISWVRTSNNTIDAELASGRKDISLGDYYSYRFGRPGLVDKTMSAMVHGITGGDVYKQSLASSPWADWLVDTDEMPLSDTKVRSSDYELMMYTLKNKAVFDLATEHLKSKSLWFRHGFSTLANALVEALKENPNVTIKTGDPVTSVRYQDSSDRVYITTEKNKKPVPYEKVVSTIYAKRLASVTDDHLPSLASSTAVSIMLVHLWYPVPHANFPHSGFGYLLPQALPHEANPECILGVIFDSDREFPLPSASNPHPANLGADTVHGTKLTVMMGGHYWDDLPRSFLPDEDTAIDMAKRAVQRHLRLDPALAEKAVARAELCADCIPQHVAGHAGRMRAAHAELQWAFKGRLAVAGQSYQSPGVLASLRAGRDIAFQIGSTFRGQRIDSSRKDEWPVGDTGLERFTRQPLWISIEKRKLPLRFDSGASIGEDGKLQPAESRTQR